MNGSAVSFLWLIPFFPLAGALINGLLAASTSHRPHGPNRALVAWIACLAPAASFAVTVAGFFSLRAMEPAERLLTQRLFTWIRAGDLTVDLGFLFDPLSSAMLLFVTGIGFLIHLYSVGYMSHDRGFARYFAYLNLFMFAMILLVLGDSLPVLFIGWEGVGLCSYLLIGFWHEDPEKAKAGMKAFVVNRIGDFGFLLGMFLIFWTLREGGTPTLAFAGMKEQAYLLGGAATAIGLLLFLGAAGKSAQIPLYVWLPDAMAGPTPVSALIHAATMVTSGVYMVTRMSFLYDLAPAALAVVAVVGALTALLAATIGLTQFDIKKVLAYSTVSQLGFMFLGAGVGAYAAGMFHVVTHAFFKALLFLGAGSVIHALSGEQDIRKMGGLFRKIPVTSRTFLVAWLAICGIFPFAGFFSKDEILWKAFSQPDPAASWLPQALWLVAFLTAAITAIYMTRLVVLTFFGRSRVDHAVEHHIHESPWTMTAPLIVLAIGSTVIGFAGTPPLLGMGSNRFEGWLHPVVASAPAVPASVTTIDLGRPDMPKVIVPPRIPHGEGEAAAPAASVPEHALAGHDATTEHAPAGHDATTGHAAAGHEEAGHDATTGHAAAGHEEAGHEVIHAGGLHDASDAHVAHGEHHDPAVEWALIAAALILALLAMILTWRVYTRSPQVPQRVAASLGGLYRLAHDKYRVDELYDAAVVRPLVGGSRRVFHELVDVRVIDFLVNLVGITARLGSYAVRFVQTGYVQAYALVLLVGLVFVLLLGR